jgi:hypothetical protein
MTAPSLHRLLLLAILSLLAATTPARADDAATCQANAGTLLVGTLKGPPRFTHGRFRKGVELSHTHLKVVDAAGQSYDVAIDNVFAAGYKKNAKGVPAPLNQLKDGDRVSACGAPFDGGVHWVHTNCGAAPSPQAPNGWLKKLNPDGTPSDNYEGSETYCKLWTRH